MHGMINFPHMFSFDSVGVGVGSLKYIIGVVDHFIIKFLFPSDKEMANKYMHGMII